MIGWIRSLSLVVYVLTFPHINIPLRSVKEESRESAAVTKGSRGSPATGVSRRIKAVKPSRTSAQMREQGKSAQL